MIMRLSHATVYVLDQEEALKFYRDKLGLRDCATAQSCAGRLTRPRCGITGRCYRGGGVESNTAEPALPWLLAMLELKVSRAVMCLLCSYALI